MKKNRAALVDVFARARDAAVGQIYRSDILLGLLLLAVYVATPHALNPSAAAMARQHPASTRSS